VIVLSALFYVLKVPLGRALLTAIVVSLLIHFVFYKLLRVPLPWGILVNHTW
jgi:putative tricarboxylic transport membrane protein